ncbi:hypothetical protein EJB05_02306 [Eragrostis curvula]|uniref:Uncharacterized protein n=1 Tax=Eragrostis curvula TaxID=38414 RepID=A0A5J9WRR8_9POAL|nr:hypothetical protein EJB05_02306 [Eragrostis curvula]
MAFGGSRSAITAPQRESGAASRFSPPLSRPLLPQEQLAIFEIALSLMICVKVPRIKRPFDNSGIRKDPCCSRKSRVPRLRAHTACWLWIFVLTLFPIPGVNSVKGLIDGSCRYDLTSVAALSCLQPNGAVRPPSLTCCKALLYAVDHVPASDQSGACCLCRYMRDKEKPELATTYILCKGKDRRIVKKWSSFAMTKCSTVCRKGRDSSLGVGISADEDHSLENLHNSVKAKGIFHVLWASVMVSVLMGLICWYLWRSKMRSNASEQGGPQAEGKGSPGLRSVIGGAAYKYLSAAAVLPNTDPSLPRHCHRVSNSVAAMAVNLRVGAALQMLICLCLLAAPASGLDFPVYYPPAEAIIIDLGNTNSCVAGYHPAKAETAFQFCVPSWVAFTGDGTALVGEAAKKHADDAGPGTAIFGFKRLLGLRRNRIYHEDIVQGAILRMPYKIGTRDGDMTTIQVIAMDGTIKQLAVDKIASMLIAQLKEKAEEHLGRKVEYAVVTVPLHFHDAPKWAIRFAGKLARLDIEVDAMVTEPVAAAAAYGLHRKLREDGNVLVLRVGGGTADASILTLIDGSFDIFGYGYDHFLGGDDFDQRVVDYFVQLIKTKHGKDISEDRIALGKLRTACERAKKALSSQDRVQVNVESLFDGVDFSELLLRSDFEQLNDDLFKKVIALVEEAMVDAELEKNMIDEIVLVGGSTMIPKIQKLVKDYFGGKAPNIRVKPDEAIALGAAVLVHSQAEYRIY